MSALISKETLADRIGAEKPLWNINFLAPLLKDQIFLRLRSPKLKKILDLNAAHDDVFALMLE